MDKRPLPLTNCKVLSILKGIQWLLLYFPWPSSATCLPSFLERLRRLSDACCTVPAPVLRACHTFILRILGIRYYSYAHSADKEIEAHGG